jgi:hypothetical protein
MLRDFHLLFANCWLEVSMHPAGPETGHLDTGFLGSSSKGRDGCHHSKLLLHASHALSKLTPLLYSKK